MTILRTLSLLLLLAALSFTPSCVTHPDGTRGPSPAALRIAERATHTGVRLDLIAHPEHRPQYTVALHALNSLLADDQWDPAKLAAALEALPVNQLHGVEGQVLISDGLLIWDTLTETVLRIDRAAWLKDFAVALRDGLARALATGQAGG